MALIMSFIISLSLIMTLTSILALVLTLIPPLSKELQYTGMALAELVQATTFKP